MRKAIFIRISTKTYKILKDYAYRQGIPMSVVVRNAILKYLKNEGIQVGEEEKEESKEVKTKPGLAIIPKK